MGELVEKEFDIFSSLVLCCWYDDSLLDFGCSDVVVFFVCCLVFGSDG